MDRIEESTVSNGSRLARSDIALRAERGIKEVAPEVFRVRVNTGTRDPLTGSPKQLERVVRGGIREARRVRSELETKVRAGGRGVPSMTVGELLDAWLAGCAKRVGKTGRGGLEQSSYNNYELQVRTLKATQLARVRLDQITSRQPVEEDLRGASRR